MPLKAVPLPVFIVLNNSAGIVVEVLYCAAKPEKTCKNISVKFVPKLVFIALKTPPGIVAEGLLVA